MSLTFKVHPVDKVTVVTAEWPKKSRYEVIQAFQSFNPDRIGAE